jgi:LacI family transcriptional regulator
VAVIDWNAGSNRGVLRGIRAYARDKPDWILRHTTTHTPREILLQWKPDGVIAQLDEGPIMAALRRRGIPVVVVLMPHVASRPLVTTNNQAVGKLVAADFLKRGFHHFAMVGAPSVRSNRDRMAGFAAQLAAAGYKPMAYAISPRWERRHEATGFIGWHKELQVWLEALPRPVGVFVTNDVWAREAAELCQLAGLQVPEQVAIIGVDNDELLCEMAQPELSSVLIPWEKMGFEAANCLDRVMNGAAAGTEPVLVEPGGIVTRHSSDVMAVSEPLLAQALRFINQHACEHIHIKDVLRAVPISRRWLEWQCQRTLGRSPLQEIRRVRMAKARQLLATTDLQLWRIAEHCAVDEKKFAGIFRKETGLTPSQWRRRLLPRRN